MTCLNCTSSVCISRGRSQIQAPTPLSLLFGDLALTRALTYGPYGPGPLGPYGP